MKKVAIVISGIFILFLVGVIIISRNHKLNASLFPKKFKIGMILCGSHENGGLSEAHYKSVLRVAKERGLVLEFFENVPYDERCREKIEELIYDGCQVIILDSRYYEEYSIPASEAHPETGFINSYGSGFSENYLSFSGRMYQPNYLCGMVAGMQTENNRIGYLAASPATELICDINAFTLGVRKVNPEASVYVGYTESADGVLLISRLVESYGIDVIMNNTYTDTALRYAEKRGIWSIGCHMDHSDIYPKSYLTSIIWNLDDFYDKEIMSCREGRFTGENIKMGIDSSFVDISPLTENVKPGIAEVVNKERERLKNREFDVFYGPVYDSEGVLRAAENESIPDIELFKNLNGFVSGVEFYEFKQEQNSK